MIHNLEHAKHLLKELEQFFINREKEKDKWMRDVITHIPTIIEGKNMVEFINYDNVCIFRHRHDHEGFSNGILWVNYDLVWKVLATEYEMSYQKIQDYIREKIQEHTYDYYPDIHCFSAPEYSGKMITKNICTCNQRDDE